jgi:hypothetical protein
MLPQPHKQRNDRACPDPIASGSLPWLLEEFARIEARYLAKPEPYVESTEAGGRDRHGATADGQ